MPKFPHLLLIATLLIAACSNPSAIVAGCEPVGGMEPICGFKNPEDIEALPDRKTLLISQMGVSMDESTPGSLVFFDTVTNAVTPAFPSPIAPAASSNWGASDCPGNPGAAFAPHGIALKQRDDGRWQVAAVNHGGRESVEMFELIEAAGSFHLEWRGCVVPDAGTFMNDVVLLKNGGFIASHMYDKHAAHFFGVSTGAVKAMLGVATGYVFEWQKDTGVRILEESRGAFLNGVEISADDSTVFANVYFGNELRKLDRRSGKKLGASTIAKADNLAWDAAHAFLLDVSHTGSTAEQMDCMQHPGKTCVLAYTVYRINPDSMQSEVLFHHAGLPMGAATVARELNGAFYLGSYTGDRVVKMPVPQVPIQKQEKSS